MPKQTFLNLPDEKRNSFIDIALVEFANNNYKSASISKIVEKAGIAKGSLYQYFEDKRDLFLYLLDLSNQVMMEYIQQTAPPDPKADFFDTLRWQMTASVKAANQYPVHSKLAQRAYSSSLPFQDEILEQAQRLRDSHFRALISQAQSSGQLDPDLDTDVVNFMVQGLLTNLGSYLQKKFAENNDNWLDLPEVEQVFNQIIKVLKNGLGC